MIELLEGPFANVYKINSKHRKLNFSLRLFLTSYLNRRKQLRKPLNCSLCTFFFHEKGYEVFCKRCFKYFQQRDHNRKRMAGWILIYIPLLCGQKYRLIGHAVTLTGHAFAMETYAIKEVLDLCIS